MVVVHFIPPFFVVLLLKDLIQLLDHIRNFLSLPNNLPGVVGKGLNVLGYGRRCRSFCKGDGNWRKSLGIGGR
jgi:hypothetical protein